MAWRPRPITVAAGGISLAAFLACYDDGSSGFVGEDDPDDAWDGDEGEWLGEDDEEPDDGCAGSSLVAGPDGKTVFLRVGDSLFGVDGSDGSSRELLVADGGWYLTFTAGTEALVVLDDEVVRLDTLAGEIARSPVPDAGYPITSPTGAWTRLTGDARWIRLLDAVALTERTLLVPDDAALRGVTWRPGTDDLVAVGEIGDPDQRVRRVLFHWNLEDSGPVAYDLPAFDHPYWLPEEEAPSWLSVSPDGLKVAVPGIEPLEERFVVTVVDLETGAVDQHLDLQGPVGWTADGAMVGWAAEWYPELYGWFEEVRLVVAPPDGAEPVQVPVGGTDRPSFALTPDGQRAVIWSYAPYYQDDGDDDWWPFDGEYIESWFVGVLPLDGAPGQAIGVRHAQPPLRFVSDDVAAYLDDTRRLNWLWLDPLAITPGEAARVEDFEVLDALGAMALSPCPYPGRVDVRAVPGGELLHTVSLTGVELRDTSDTGAPPDTGADSDPPADTSDTASP